MGWRVYLADLNLSVGDGWFEPGGLMVEICVAVPDPVCAHGLMRGLGGLFDRSSVSFDRARNEVRVSCEWESRAVIRVVEVVENWLVADGIPSAKLSIGDQSCIIVCSGGSGQSNGRAA
jgi:hypothetical protein